MVEIVTAASTAAVAAAVSSSFDSSFCFARYAVLGCFQAIGSITLLAYLRVPGEA